MSPPKTLIDFWPHPITSDGREFLIASSGQTLAEVLSGRLPRSEPAVAIINGCLYDQEKWYQVVLREGDVVQVRVAPGGDSESNPIAAILTIAVLIGAPYLAPVLGFTGIGATLFTIGVQVAGLLIVNSLFPPRAPDNDTRRAKRQYSLAGGSNAIRQNEPMLLLLGSHRVFPDYAAKEYSSYDEQGDHFVSQIFDFGLGKLDIENHRIGETLITEYKEVEMSRDNIGNHFEESSSHSLPGGELSDNVWRRTTFTPEGTVRITFNLIVTNFTIRSVSIGRVGNRQEREAVPVWLEIQYRRFGTAKWQSEKVQIVPSGSKPLMKDISYTGLPGEYEGQVRILSGLTENGSVSYTLTSYQSVGSAAPQLVAGNVDTIQGGELKHDEPLIRSTPQETFQIAFDVNVQHFRATDEGRLEGRDTEILMGYRPAGSTEEWQEQLYTIPTPRGVEARNAVRRSFTVNASGSEHDDYDVRVTLVTEVEMETDEHGEMRIKDERVTFKATLVSIRAFQRSVADFLGQNPLAVRIKATGQLFGRLETFNADAHQLIPSFNGVAWLPDQRTSNPGDILRKWYQGFRDENGTLIGGYGHPDELIDHDALQGFVQHCTDHGLECNVVLEDERDEDEIATLIAQCGWGRVNTSTGKYGVLWEDAERPVTALVTPANIVGGTLNVSYDNENLADEIIGRFVDRESDFKENTVRRPVPNLTITGEFPVEVALEGVTDRDHAAKEINRAAAAQFYHTRIITWEMLEEGFAGIGIGDVVGMANGLLGDGEGGRLLTIDAARTSMDIPFEPESDTGIAWVWLLDGTVMTTTYQKTQRQTIQFDDPLPTPPVDVGSFEEPYSYRFMLFPTDSIYIRARVTAFESSGQGRYRFTARDELQEYYDFRTSDLTSQLIPPGPQAILADGTLSGDPGQIPVGGFSVTTNALGVRIFSWTQHPLEVDGYAIRYGAIGTTFSLMTPLHEGLLSVSPFEVLDRPPDGTWTFAIIAILSDSKRPTIPTYVTATLGATAADGGIENALAPNHADTPPKPLDLIVTCGFEFCMVEWVDAFLQYTNHKLTHIYRSTSEDVNTAVRVGSVDWNIFVDQTVELSTTYYYWVRFESVEGVEGPFSDVASGKTAIDLDAYHDNLLQEIRESPLTEWLLSPITNPQYVTAEIRRLAARAAFLSASAELRLQAELNRTEAKLTLAEEDIVSIQENIVQTRAELAGKASTMALMSLSSVVATNGETIQALSQSLTRLMATVDGKATATALQALTTRVTVSESEIESLSESLTRLTSTVDGKADAIAVQSLTTRVTTAEGRVESLSESLTSLMATVNNKADASAFRALTTRVTTAEGRVDSLSQSLTQLTATVNSKANASALNALTAQVTTHGGEIDSLSESLTRLMAEVNGKADATAMQGLAARVTTAEGRIVSQGSLITELSAQIANAATSSAVRALTSRVTTAEGRITSISSDVTTLRSSIAGKADASAQTLLEARVSNAENVEGSTDLGTLARWLVKTRVNDLAGGVGLLNDGTSTKFFVRADTFAILPRNILSSDLNNIKIPFAVRNGQVWLNEALIQAATIASAQIRSLAADKVTGLDAKFNTLTVNLARVTGTLSATHVDADVANIHRLAGSRFISSSTWTSIGLSRDMDDFDILMVYVNPRNSAQGGSNSTMPASLDVGRLSTSPPSRTFGNLHLAYQIGALDGQGCQGHAYRSFGGTTLYLRTFSNEPFDIDAVYGVKL